jgi:hypothetical protein
MTTPKKYNPFSNKFDYYDKPVSQISVVTTAADLIATVAAIQKDNLAGTILLRNDLNLLADTTVDLTGIVLNLNGFNIFQGHTDHYQGYKFRIKGTGWQIVNGSFWYNNVAYSEVNLNNNLGIELLGNANDTTEYTSISVRGIFDGINFCNYVGTTVSDSPCIKTSNSNPQLVQWGSIQLTNCIWLSMTGSDGSLPDLKIDNSPFVFQLQATKGTTIVVSKYRSYHHQAGDYGRSMKLITASNSNGVQFQYDGSLNLLNTNIITDWSTTTSGGIIGLSCEYTSDFIRSRKLTTDKTGKFALIANPVTEELEQIAIEDLNGLDENGSLVLPVGTSPISILPHTVKVFAIEVSESVGSSLIPHMTNEITPSGIASDLSNSGSGFESFRAFQQKNNTEKWCANGINQWLQYYWNGNDITFDTYGLSVTTAYLSIAATAWRVQVSNDGIVWTTVDTRTATTITDTEQLFSISSAHTCKYIRITVTASLSSNAYSAFNWVGIYAPTTTRTGLRAMSDNGLFYTLF